MKLYDQQYTADRADGHTSSGIPGDCLRAAVATVLQAEPNDLHHYATHVSWWDTLRMDARKRDLDWACTYPDEVASLDLPDGYLLIASGPSPRGPFWHAVVVDRDLELVHDPHPSRAGILSIKDVLYYCQPYEPAPTFKAVLA